MSDKITPCKCGGKARLYRNGLHDWYIECSKCGAKIEGDTREEVTERWKEENKDGKPGKR